MNNASPFNIGDFYSLETLLNAKYTRGLFGTYTKTSTIIFSGDIVNSLGEIRPESSKHKIIFDTQDLDLHKMCLSFVFWTKKITRNLPGRTIWWLRRSIMDIIQSLDYCSGAAYTLIEDDIFKNWNDETLSAAVMYLLKYLSRNAQQNYDLTDGLLKDFCGAYGYGSRDHVFGRDDSICSQKGEYLVDEYNNALSENCGQLIEAVNRLNNLTNNRLNKKKHFINLHMFLIEWCKVSEKTFSIVCASMEKANVEKTITTLVQFPYRCLPDNICKMFPECNRLRFLIESAKMTEYSPEECPNCWMVSKGMKKICGRQHESVVPSKPSTPLIPPEYAPVVPSVQSEPSALQEQSVECSVCCTEKINTRLGPCGHMYCSKCATSVVTCPYCRTEIVTRDVAYII